MRTLLLITLLLSLQTIGATVTTKTLHAIAMQESGNRTGLKGDLHLKTPSVGLYQVRDAYLKDVLRVYGKECVKQWGRQLTMNDMLTSREKSTWVVSRYLSYYGGLYEKRTGLKATPEVLAKIHNGGPRGADPKYKALYANTSHYSKKVMKHYQKT
jgi:hypothetical protein